MDSTKKISVIIPVYNGRKYIINCLNSLEKQTYKNIEVILINDGSSDDTETVIQNYMEKSSLKIQYFSQSNHGQAYTRNFGTEKATGETRSKSGRAQSDSRRVF